MDKKTDIMKKPQIQVYISPLKTWNWIGEWRPNLTMSEDLT